MCPILLTREALPPVFFDLDDIESIAFRRGIRYLPKTSSRLLSYLMLPALFWGQYRSVRLSHRTFICSEIDRRYLTKCYRLKGVVIIPNAVKIPEEQPLAPEPMLLFIGSYSFKPNLDAAEFLIKQIWPLVHQKIPNATLIIAGSHPDRISSYDQGRQGVRFTGFVEDLDGLYRQSRVVCAPILWGGGTRVKIIEAAAYRKPIVSTVMGAEGIEMHDGYGIFLRDDPKSFAEACIRLLSDREFCERMGAAARAAIINKYDQKKIKPMIQEYITTPKIGENKSKTSLVQ
jgi:glycosyltransferase involved in cell wall biosynthesis